MYLLYNVLLIIYLLVMTPAALIRNMKEPGYIKRLIGDSGKISLELSEKIKGTRPIWIHAASVGEIVASAPVVKVLSDTYEGRPIVVSVVTKTGYAMAQKMIPHAAGIIYFPMDLFFSVKSMMTNLNPSLVVLIETEIWPNLIFCAKNAQVPMVLVNGRISDKSFKKYKRVDWFFKRILPYLSLFSMQSDLDAKRIMQMGAPAEKIRVFGNTKYDEPFPFVSEEEKNELSENFKLDDAYPIIVGGSTHEGEEEELLLAYKGLKEVYERAALVLVPRRTYRAKEIYKMAQSMGYCIRLRSEEKKWAKSNKGTDVLIVDTIGELIRLYALGDYVFVGGSLVSVGGHNVLEPSFFGKPIIVGPHMNNFKEIYKMLKDNDAIYTVQNNHEELEAYFLELAAHPEEAKDMGHRAVQVILDNQGAAEKTVEAIDEMVYKKGSSHE